MPRVLIIGASRGIGRGLVERHLADGWEVHATTRDGGLPGRGDTVVTHRLDVTDSAQLQAMIESLDQPFDRIIHNAGINRGPKAEIMKVNAEAPINVLQAMLDANLLVPDGAIAIMTSQMGARRGRTDSLGDYGDSKAALNDEFRHRADRWRESGAIAIVMHPGWVRTDMGGSGASISVTESVDGIARVLEALDASQHGQFLTWEGRVHPW
jgi:NAD(P)-dependent dehydrogenase (short-subunit alcohol dehydrogenase family)